jgi:hypothetical protein
MPMQMQMNNMNNMPMLYNGQAGMNMMNNPYGGGMFNNHPGGYYPQPQPQMMMNYMPYGGNINPMINMNNVNMNNYNSQPYNNSQPIKLMDNSLINNSNYNQQRSVSSKHRNNLDQNTSRNLNDKINILNNNSDSTVNNDYFAKKRTHSSSSNSNADIYGGNYKPYTLQEYKVLPNEKAPLGKLGPNLGTKEWHEKNGKMKKMNKYADQVNGTNKVILKIKKETPVDIIERERREKIEASNRFKSYEYGKLVRPKPRTSGVENLDKYYQDLGIINENEEKKYNFLNDTPSNNKQNININGNGNGNKSNNIRYGEDNDINFHKGRGIKKSNEANEIYNDDDNEVVKLLKQRETYNLKINEIKESLLK